MGVGFTVSITVNGSSFSGLKVVVIVDHLVYTVTATGVVHAFSIPEINRVD